MEEDGIVVVFFCFEISCPVDGTKNSNGGLLTRCMACQNISNEDLSNEQAACRGDSPEHLGLPEQRAVQ